MDLQILRKGKVLNLTIHMEAPPEKPSPSTHQVEGTSPLSGATIANLSPALATEMNLHDYSGVVITKIAPQTKAAIIGFLPSDIILAVNKQKITSVKELRSALAEPLRNWIISLKRGDKIIEATLAR